MTKAAHAIAAFNAASARADFPIFAGAKPPIYLDSASSAQKPQAVIDAMTRFYETSYANVHRGLYDLSANATRYYENARATVARFTNTPVNGVVFTCGATESLNLVARSWGAANLKPGDEIVITALEHHANIVPWQMIAQKTGAVLRVVPINENGDITLDAVSAVLSPRTKMLAVTHMSNALGTILPVADMIAAAKKIGAATLVDGCQAVCHIPLDFEKLGCDFYVFSAHKLYGPTGIGVLLGRPDMLNAMPPFLGGGDMIDVVTFDKTTFKNAPARFEAGTPPIAEAVGLAAAIDYVSAHGVANIARAESALYAYAVDALGSVAGLTFYGHGLTRAGIVSFTANWSAPADIATLLARDGLCVRAGHHCCMPLMKILGVAGTVRVSLGLYNTHADIDALIAGLAKAKRLLS